MRAGFLQNLSNWPCKDQSVRRSLDMTTITKKLRLLFYGLATLELMLLSALYAWGHTGLHH